MQQNIKKVKECFSLEEFETGFDYLKKQNDKDLNEKLAPEILDAVKKFYFGFKDEFEEDDHEESKTWNVYGGSDDWESDSYGDIDDGLKMLSALLPDLNELDLSYCTFQSLPDGLKLFPKLSSLDLTYCKDLYDLDGLEGCSTIVSIRLDVCYHLEDLKGLKNCPNLTHLSLHYCEKIESLDDLCILASLKEIELGGGETLLNNVKGLADCTNLKKIALKELKSNSLPDGIGLLRSLEELNLYQSEELTDLSGLESLINLISLDLGECYKLKNLDQIVGLSKLNYLNLEFSEDVQPEPENIKMTTREEIAKYQRKIQEKLANIYNDIYHCHICPKMDPFKEKRNLSAVSQKTKVFIISQALAEKQLRISGVNFFTSDGILGSTGKQLEKFLNTFNQTVFPPNDIILKNGSVINQGDLNKISVYNTEITQCFPGKVAKGDRKPEPIEIKNCLDKNFLFREIQIIKPKLLLLMGRLSIVTFYKYILRENVNTSTNEMIDDIVRKGIIPKYVLGEHKIGFLPIQHASGLNPQYHKMLKNFEFIKLIKEYFNE